MTEFVEADEHGNRDKEKQRVIQKIHKVPILLR